MALNQLKKWVGTQLWSTFMTEYNENVDATNAAIDLAEQNAANISLFDGTTIVTLYNTGTSLPVNAVKLGWNSLPLNSASVPVTLCIIRVSNSNIALAVVIKNSDTGGKAYMISGLNDAGIHTLASGTWS